MLFMHCVENQCLNATFWTGTFAFVRISLKVVL